MKIVRQITYEISDTDADRMNKLERQMQPSAPNGSFTLNNGITLTIEQIHGPVFPATGSSWGGPRPEPYKED